MCKLLPSAGSHAIYAKENEITLGPGQRWTKWIRNDGVVMEGEQQPGREFLVYAAVLAWFSVLLC